MSRPRLWGSSPGCGSHFEVLILRIGRRCLREAMGPRGSVPNVTEVTTCTHDEI